MINQLIQARLLNTLLANNATIKAYYPLQDPANTPTPHLAYPSPSQATAQINQSGTIDYQQSEPFTSCGTGATTTDTSSYLELQSINTGDYILFLLNLASCTDFAALSSTIPLGPSELNIAESKTYLPILVRKDSATQVTYFIGNASDPEYGQQANTFKIHSLYGASVHHLTVIDGSSTTLQTAIDIAHAALTLEGNTHMLDAAGISALYAPEALVGFPYSTPPFPVTNHTLGVFHTDTADATPSLVIPQVEASTSAELTLLENPTDSNLTINVDTIIPLTFSSANQTVGVNGQTPFAVTSLNQIKLVLTLDPAANTVVIDVHDETQLRGTVTVSLATAANEFTRIDLGTPLSLARVEANWLTADVSGATERYGVVSSNTMFPLVGTGSVDYTDAARNNVRFNSGYSSYNQNRTVRMVVTVSTGEFTIASEMMASGTLEISTNLYNLSHNLGWHVIASTVTPPVSIGQPILAFGATTLISVTVNDSNLVQGFIGTDFSTPEFTHQLPPETYVYACVVLRDASNNLKFFVNGQLVHTVANFTSDVGLNPTDAYGKNIAVCRPPHGFRFVAAWERAITDQEAFDIVNARHSVYEPPASGIKNVTGKVQGAASGSVWLLSYSTGNLIATTTIDTDGSFVFTNVSLQGKFMILAEDGGGKIYTSIMLLNGVDTEVPPNPPLQDGLSGTKQITGASVLAGTPHPSWIFMYDKTDMTPVLRHSAFGGDYIIKTDFTGTVRVLEVHDDQVYYYEKVVA